MFTGLIEHVGSVTHLTRSDRGAELAVALGPLLDGLAIGDSICVSGMCLTVTRFDTDTAWFDISAESLRKTTAGSWRPGASVNLERALAVGDRLGGHMVGGHVDGVGRLLERRREGSSERLTFVTPDDGSVLTVEKGSVTVDGVSLTTWDCRGARFSVAVVPHTLAMTTLADLRPGSPVNLEQDVLGRWVAKLMEQRH